MKNDMKIGIVSDTHGMLRPEVIETLEGCEAILHGGDITGPEILEKLGDIAPVHAVRGNGDREWAEYIPLLLDFELAGLRICMAHKKKDLPADVMASLKIAHWAMTAETMKATPAHGPRWRDRTVE